MIDAYETAAARSGFVLDDGQRAVALRLQRLASDLESRRLWTRRPCGIYLSGPVGVGKSWLTTVMFETLRLDRKRRLHFHEFFRTFHGAYSQHRHTHNAIERAVDDLLGGVRFLCFDEFHVHDAGDAMLISRLLRTLFARKITLVTTSNYAPTELLPNPLYHHLVEPTVQVIEANLDVVKLHGTLDYRSGVNPDRPRSRFERGQYLWPGSDAQLRELGLAPTTRSEYRLLKVNGRQIRALAIRGDLVWFDFEDLCGSLTSTLDYLSLCDQHSRWVLTGLPSFPSGSCDSMQRFANLVDVLVDRDVELVLTGQEPLERVMSSDSSPWDAARTMSRLSLLTSHDASPQRAAHTRA